MPKADLSKEVSSSAGGAKAIVERGEAVCFTAGLHGAPFGAGVLHAYLSTGRPAPKVVAGISLGAVTSAAFQRAYRELEGVRDEENENVRWDWYRRYLNAISEKPFEVIWQGIPNQSDFFAEFTPVKDPFPETLKDERLKAEMAKAEEDARRDLTLFVYLGRWLSKVSISIGGITHSVISFVRYKEGYGHSRIRRLLAYYWSRASIFLNLIVHTARNPEFVKESEFGRGPQNSFVSFLATAVGLLPLFFLISSLLDWRVPRGWVPWLLGGIPYLAICGARWWVRRHSRPLFGWPVYGVCLACTWIMITAVLLAGLPLAWRVRSLLVQIVPESWLGAVPLWLREAVKIFARKLPEFGLGVLVFLGVVLVVVGLTLVLRLLKILKAAQPSDSFSESEQWAIRSTFQRQYGGGIRAFCKASLDNLKQSVAHEVFANLNLHRSLVNDYYLRRAIFELFHENGSVPQVGSDPFPVVLVAAPLQVLRREKMTLGACQVWAQPGSSLIDALRASLAVPGLYEPLPVEQTENWDIGGADNPRLDLVDGYVIRQNPIPALFNFLAKDTDKRIAQQLCGTEEEAPRVHVVYSVPVQPMAREKKDCQADIVDVGLAALKLSRRRDTELEVHQTNLLSKIELQVRAVGQRSANISPMFADEIAPDTDTEYKNPLDPTRDEVLKRVASGCRATLEVLHSKELAQIRGSSPEALVDCDALMKKVSARRRAQTIDPGLPEVCACCTRKLRASIPDSHRKSEPGETAGWSSIPDSSRDKKVVRDAPQLQGSDPRIVFVASGGVFRGAFHAGMLAALVAAHIKPDLIVGASVGTLMGGTLAAAFCADDYDLAVAHLGLLTTVLMRVDKEIAFTKPLKNAVRNVGIRGRDITLSPRKTRSMILDGSQADAGFAAVGAPSALIDAISLLLLIPHKETADIAAEFVAGHVTLATKKLLEQLRRETLRHLSIEFSIIGSSLIQPAATRLLSSPGIDLRALQPYQKKRKIAVYGTTIDFWSQKAVLLGVKVKDRGPRYDFVEATLCSSAFPCVFAARRESDLYPGSGLSNILYCDGGMFDNLPFLPAIEIMSRVQEAYLRTGARMPGRDPVEVSLAALEDRIRKPDLFIAGSLDVNVQVQEHTPERFDNIIDITGQASSLQNNVKIKSFEQVCNNTDGQLQRLAASARKNKNGAKLDRQFIDTIVNPAVLPVYPVDAEHLNGTFAFCASTGLKKDRLKDSIADGCFQTFRALIDPASSSSVIGSYKPDGMDPKPPLNRSIEGLKDCGKLPEIAWKSRQEGNRGGADRNNKENNGHCPFFQCSASPQDWPRVIRSRKPTSFSCPFYLAAGVLDKQADEAGKQVLEREKQGEYGAAAKLEEQQNLLHAQAFEMRDLYGRCVTDQRHRKIHGDAQKIQKAVAPEPPSPPAKKRAQAASV